LLGKQPTVKPTYRSKEANGSYHVELYRAYKSKGQSTLGRSLHNKSSIEIYTYKKEEEKERKPQIRGKKENRMEFASIP